MFTCTTHISMHSEVSIYWLDSMFSTVTIMLSSQKSVLGRTDHHKVFAELDYFVSLFANKLRFEALASAAP
eukprot:scaffold76382_cov37-Prasinocladus_malaysianus.AAC.1